MNEQDRRNATIDLSSTDSEKRLTAARYFARFGSASDLELLRRCVSFETVSWVRKALEKAIFQIGNVGVGKPPILNLLDSTEVPQALVRDLAAEAIEEVASTILHEFSPIVGSLKLAARAEVQNYEGSKTERLVEHLSKMLRALRNLNRAASVPKYEEVDIHQLIVDLVEIQAQELEGINIRLAGPTPFVILADKDALNLAVANGLRNSIEAIQGFVSPRIAEIIFNWGRGGPEYWLVMIDSGPGFVGDPADALKLGVSNKKDHLGYGLYTARVAMASMDGVLNVSNHIAGGACFELRWFKENAYTVR